MNTEDSVRVHTKKPAASVISNNPALRESREMLDRWKDCRRPVVEGCLKPSRKYMSYCGECGHSRSRDEQEP